jgi:nucleoside-diphosphate-sugar epimerase|tara:strand:- start:118 stop:972 length:855 start_codon:yes stop_codon:yes gene_type:complete
MSATIFILGGGGFIGFNLAKKLSENNYNVVIIDNFIPKVPITFNCTYYCGDIRNITDMLVLVEKYNPDCFIWAVDLLPCNNLYYDVCINGLTTILNIMNISNIKQFIYLSSSEIYGNCEYANENTMCAPLTTEGKTKLLSEDIIKNNYLYDYFILRVSNVYDNIIQHVPNYKNHIINQIDLFQKNIIAKIFLNNITSDYVHIDDLIIVITKCLYKLNVYPDNKVILNIGIENTKSDLRIFNLIYNTNKKPPIYGFVSVVKRINTLNCNKCKNVLLWEPIYKSIL